MKETNHDYQGCLTGNHYDSKCSGLFESWNEFKNEFAGFMGGSIAAYDDTYNFIFRYDINKESEENYELELCVMLQRKGVYLHLYVENISQDELDGEIKDWLKGRSDYMKALWKEVM